MAKDSKQAVNSQRGSEKSKGGNAPASKPASQTSPHDSKRK